MPQVPGDLNGRSVSYCRSLVCSRLDGDFFEGAASVSSFSVRSSSKFNSLSQKNNILNAYGMQLWNDVWEFIFSRFVVNYVLLLLLFIIIIFIINIKGIIVIINIIMYF